MKKFIFNLWSLITSSCLAHCSVDCNRPDQLPFLPELSGHLNRVLKCDVIILQTFPFKSSSRDTHSCCKNVHKISNR